jgi:hypothetical protein
MDWDKPEVVAFAANTSGKMLDSDSGTDIMTVFAARHLAQVAELVDALVSGTSG